MNISLENVSFLKNRFTHFLSAASLNMAVVVFMTLLDSIFAGKLIGEDAVSIVGIALPFFGFANFVGGIIGLGSSTMYCRSLGECDDIECRKIFGQSIILSISSAIIISVLSFIIIKPYLYYTGVSEDIKKHVIEYFNVYIITMFLTPIYYTIEEMVYADGDDTLCIISSIFQIIVKIASMYILTVKLGIVGIAIGSALSFLVATVILCIHFFKKSSSFKFTFYVGLKEIIMMIKLSIVDAIIYLCWALLSIFLIKIVVANFGEIYVPIVTIIFNLLEITIIFDAIGEAISPLSEISLGEKNIADEKEIVTVGLKIAVIEGFFASEIIFLIAPYIPTLFGLTNATVVEEATNAIRFLSFSYIFYSIIFLFTSQYLTVRKILLANIVSISSHFLFIFICCILLIKPFGIRGIWLSFPLAEIIVIIVFAIYTYMKYGKERFPFLCEKDDGVYVNYSFVLSRRNINEVILGLEKYLYDHNISQKAISIVNLIIEEMAIVVNDENLKDEIFAEYTLRINDDSILLVLRDTSEAIDMLKDCKENLNPYIVKSLDKDFAKSQYLVTSSFNRYIFNIPKV